MSLPESKSIFNNKTSIESCWEFAKMWQTLANGGKEKWSNPLWRFDCGFKLDFDGPIFSISSRFYPPTKNYGERWDGKVHLNLFEKEVSIKSFDCETLEELKIKVEEYINQVAFTLENAFAKMG